MDEKELKRRAEKMVARAKVLGITKDGKPLVIDQTYELIAAEEGARNQHVLRAGMPDPKVKAMREQEGYAEWVGIVNEMDWDDSSMISHLEGFLRENALWAEFAGYARSVADEELDDSSGDDNSYDDSSEDVDLDDVAEWVGLHYKVNFDAESPAKRNEWIQRYKEAHAPEPDFNLRDHVYFGRGPMEFVGTVVAVTPGAVEVDGVEAGCGSATTTRQRIGCLAGLKKLTDQEWEKFALGEPALMRQAAEQAFRSFAFKAPVVASDEWQEDAKWPGVWFKLFSLKPIPSEPAKLKEFRVTFQNGKLRCSTGEVTESGKSARLVCVSCKRSHGIEDSIQDANGKLLCDACANRKAADAAFENYDFGEFFLVADHEGWEWDGIDTLTKKVFLEAVNLPDEPTRLVRFRVQVDNGKVLSVSVS